MIKYYNRCSGNYEIEKVAGEKYLDWIYSSPVGMGFLNLFVKKKLFSSIYGKYCDKTSSRKKIQSFISDFNIDMSGCRKKVDEFCSFNDFFSREMTEDARPIDKNDDILISPAEGRVFAYENIDIDSLIQVKGYTYSLSELISNKSIAEKYAGGTCLIVRLCPVDYHRFHFVDSGTCDINHKVKGDYYSVNPAALKKIPGLFCRNKREWSIFHSDHFGDVLYVEVGATCVGSIIQTYVPDCRVVKGSEKGYFKFGGSTTVHFFEKNTVTIDSDILNQTSMGFETKVLMGEKIGKKI